MTHSVAQSTWCDRQPPVGRSSRHRLGPTRLFKRQCAHGARASRPPSARSTRARLKAIRPAGSRGRAQRMACGQRGVRRPWPGMTTAWRGGYTSARGTGSNWISAAWHRTARAYWPSATTERQSLEGLGHRARRFRCERVFRGCGGGHRRDRIGPRPTDAPIGAYIGGANARLHFFDPKIEARQTALARAFPGRRVKLLDGSTTPSG